MKLKKPLMMNKASEPTPYPVSHLQIILDSIADGLFTVDRNFFITSFNRAAEKITGISRKDAVGHPCWKVFCAEICKTQCILRHSIETGQPVVNRDIVITGAAGRRVPVSISTAILKDEKGHIVGGVETFRDLTAEKALRDELVARRYTFRDIVGKNRKMQRIFRLLETIADSEVTVLLEGESGTGKGMFAEAIHAQSARSHRPMVTVDCGSLPHSLLESELFGYKAGAFTDAKKDKPGRISLASGGTLFLDEIANMPLELQSKFLRVLQDRIYEPLGGVSPEIADLRFIVATNRSLDGLVKAGLFREDLYYRIKVVKIVLPPLRERRDDIPMLAEHFIKKHAAINGRMITGISSEVTAGLMAYDWPGNVRELENVIEFATVVCSGEWIGLEHLPDDLASKIETEKGCGCPELIQAPGGLKEMERIYISDLFKKHGFNRKSVAAEMGVHPSTLWRKMKRLDLPLPESDGRGNHKFKP
jgi:PAS domain S-box-containing protein